MCSIMHLRGYPLLCPDFSILPRIDGIISLYLLEPFWGVGMLSSVSWVEIFDGVGVVSWVSPTETNIGSCVSSSSYVDSIASIYVVPIASIDEWGVSID